MLRSVVKSGIKSSILAFDKVKYVLGCIKEDIEDLAAEARSEVQERSTHVQNSTTKSELSTHPNAQQTSTTETALNKSQSSQEATA